MGLQKVVFNFLVKNAKGKLVTSSLIHAKPKMPINFKGLKYNPLNFSTGQISRLSCADNPHIKTLIDMGIKKSDAEVLIKMSPLSELRETLRLYQQGGHLNKVIPAMIEEYNSLCRTFGRKLDLGGLNKYTAYPSELGDIDIMTLTMKHRALKAFNNGELKCKQLPKMAQFSEEEIVQKSLVDKAFRQLKGTDYDMFQYRGECISADLPYFKKLKNLKEGETFNIPGYAWTTDSSGYAFGTYGNGASDMLEFFNKWNIKHHILCPKETKIFASRSRLGQEFLMPCDSNMKLVKKIIDKEKKEMIIYSEHIPF